MIVFFLLIPHAVLEYKWNTKYVIANHSAQDEQNNYNKFSYNDWNDLHTIHDIYINSYKKEKKYFAHLLGGTQNNVLMSMINP